MLNALKQTPNVMVNTEKNFVVPSINPLKNTIMIEGVENNERDEIRSILESKNNKNYDFSIAFDKNNQCRIIF